MPIPTESSVLKLNPDQVFRSTYRNEPGNIGWGTDKLEIT